MTGPDLHGTLFTPAGDQRRPAVLCLGGAEGGSPRIIARYLAKSGYAAFALCYFGAPGLPPTLSNVPLEYVLHALRWLRETYRPLDNFIALRGHSRGAELALLVASLVHQIAPVICYVPPARVYAGTSPSKNNSVFDPAWTYLGQKITGTALYPEMWADRMSPTRNELEGIPVERISAPLLLFSAQDDRVWDSFSSCKEIKRRRDLFRATSSFQHVSYQNAGHGIAFPPPFLLGPDWGGTPEGNSYATEDAWRRSLRFLADTHV